ncbi:sulfate transport system substrate-binding protein [Rhodovulum imhoffii]|uniref:Sulfate transport system substrate-binding protein n=2 Tax=Rhodovulum imhoffii TaxID=365340 RepID=A0A2T5BWF0_9RHOB|nr:sulfate ABC transporter substrate-binding protein [Rhodovulum imhoffii]MBK5935059.1 sulfate transporter subunit [Rhodovulum imhoffii]PTN03976.1 sulfate transport system substrate-binding protein [Rhodovulum imhoffii]
MFRTIQIGAHALAQGTFVRNLGDGRIEIETGHATRQTGRPVTPAQIDKPIASPWQKTLGATPRRGVIAAAAAIGIAFAGAMPASAQDSVEILNVSYDPTREFYREYNELFNDWWTAQGNAPVTIQQSHGGAGAQARAVIDGLEASVVTLALSADIDTIAERTGRIPEDWQSRLPHNSSPYTSTIVFLVSEGNPRAIKDWNDLIRADVSVITPNPKTSGGARWNFLAAWAYAARNGLDPAEFVGALYRNVPVLDTGARGSTTTFTQRGIGDVLLAWENEAFLVLDELGETAFDIVVPSVSILAEPPVTLVDGNIASDAQRKAAKAYLEYLYSPEAQALALRHRYRAWDTSLAAPEDIARFPKLDLVTISDFGGWPVVQPEYFGENGIFDQIYEE